MNCDPKKLSLENARSAGGGLENGCLYLMVCGGVSVREKKLLFEKMTLRFEECRPLSVSLCTRRILNFKTNSPKEQKGRKLYKSEIDGFTQRLLNEEWDFMSFSVSEKSGEQRAEFDMVFVSSGEMFTVNISCKNITAVGNDEGTELPRSKTTFSEKLSKFFKGKKSPV
ncbi:MAG: hypothetical protein NC078_08670 [Ruminococcus sp.]|nr:hypothetical protein [Ruminococcus sp.]